MDGLEEDSQGSGRIALMTPKNPAIRIFLWCEVIAAVGVVLFHIPFFLSKVFAGGALDLSVSERFSALTVFLAVFYTVAGIAALRGHPLWPLLQYMVTVLAVFLTMAFSRTLQNAGLPFEFVYGLPLICSAFAASVVFIFQKYSFKKEKL
jgi:hypothetical protein